MAEAAAAAPFDDRMLVADIVETLREGIGMDIPAASSDAGPVLARLRDLYREQGVATSDATLAAGLAALRDGRFAYAPPRGPRAVLARLYVARRQWGPPVGAVLLVLALLLGGYYLAYQPYAAAQAERARTELTQDLPARMDTLYRQIFEDTKVQSAAIDAADRREQGKAAAAKGDRAGAEAAIAQLTALRDRLAQVYSLRVIDGAGVKPGFWTFPSNNAEATRYYLVVEALGPDGQALSLPVANDDTGKTETVTRWGLLVPQSVYDSVMADKADDGVIEHGLVGIKQDGFPDPDYVVPVLGGTVTQW